MNRIAFLTLLILMLELCSQFDFDIAYCLRLSKVKVKKAPSDRCNKAMIKRQTQLNSCCSGTVDQGNVSVVTLARKLNDDQEQEVIDKDRTSLFKTICCVIEDAKVCADIIKDQCTEDDMTIVYGNIEEMLLYNFTRDAHNLIDLKCTKYIVNGTDNCADHNYV